VSFSPTGDFLATAHVDSVGIYLWYPISYLAADLTYNNLRANRAQYGEVSLRTATDTDVVEMALPSVQGAENEGLVVIPVSETHVH